MIRIPHSNSSWSAAVLTSLRFGLLLVGVSPAAASVETPTFSRDVAPIVWENCSACHRPGEAAPFSLTSYEEVRKRARLIRDVTGERIMPPWHARPGFGEFLNPRILNDEQIQTLSAWVEAGMPEGDPTQTPPFPSFASGWQLGEPDLVLTMTEPFEVRADGRDIYRYFVLPAGLAEDKWVTAIEVRPSAREAVHHILFFLDNRGTARQLDERDPGPGFRGRGFQSTGELGGWAVGTTPQHFPDGLALPMPKGSDVVLQTHFHPSGKVEQEKTTIGLYFAAGPPDKTLFGFQVPPEFGAFAGIDIPPGKADFVLEDSWTIPVDVDLVNVWGHAHQTCVSFSGKATLPDGGVKPLLEIPHWDFNWQTIYQYASPLRLPAGTRIDVRIVYDNSEGNPDNPNHPPKRIRWGEQTTDEMGSLIFQAVPAQEKDLPQLVAAEQEQKQRARLTALIRFIGREQFTAALQTIEEADANSDEKISRDELTADWKEIAFRILDRDESGFIERDEITLGREFAQRLFGSDD